jgi:hypothetical protein
MGVLCDLFVADPADAPKYEELMDTPEAGSFFQVAQWKGLTTLEFGTLWAILEGKPFDVHRHEFQSLRTDEDRWLCRFPRPYVGILAGLKAADIRKASVEWAATEELRWEPSEAEEVIESLADLAGQASDLQKGLFLWGCL